MNSSYRLSSAVAGVAILGYACAAHAQIEDSVAAQNVEPPPPAAANLPTDTDDANASPRERGRVLVKRNPIASEYQVFGDLGASPGADADGEGVDYRAFFPTADPLAIPSNAYGLGYNLNYNSLSGKAKHGFDARFAHYLGDDKAWAIAGQFNSSGSDRLIEHYEALWYERSYGDAGEKAYFLDRPRFSYDEIYTRNKTLALQLGHALSDSHSVYFKTYYQDYFDNQYRNRMEIQLGSGQIVDENDIWIQGDTARAASVTGAQTRRYFGDTDNERARQHNVIGGSYRGSEWDIEYSLYAQKWDLDTLWYDWNFNDFGLDLSYSTEDPHLPTVSAVENGALLDTSTARFTSLRIHDTYTRDRDVAGRLDAERRLLLGDIDLWIQTGILSRKKERKNGQERAVYAVDRQNPFYLSEVEQDTAPSPIVDGRYSQAKGLSPSKGRALLNAAPERFLYNAFSSEIEAAPQSYDAEESVTSAYLLGSTPIERWTLEAGGRLEYTETGTRGTVAIPIAVNDPSEGDFIKESVNPATGERIVIKNLYSKANYVDFLPSVEVSYALDEESSIRASWFQLLMRPQYFNIVDYRRINIPTRSISEGNPDLSPTSIDKLRLAWSKDSPSLGKLSVEAYLIEIESFFYGAVSNEFLIEDGSPELYRVSRVENGESGSIKGAEIQWLKPLERLPGFERGAFEFAYTFSDSQAEVATRPGETLRVPERSDHLLKTSLSGTIGRFTSELQFTYQSEALDDVGADANQDTIRGDVITTALNTRYALTPRVSLYLNLANMSDHPERSYEGSELRVTRNQFSSWYAILGARSQF